MRITQRVKKNRDNLRRPYSRKSKADTIRFYNKLKNERIEDEKIWYKKHLEETGVSLIKIISRKHLVDIYITNQMMILFENLLCAGRLPEANYVLIKAWETFMKNTNERTKNTRQMRSRKIELSRINNRMMNLKEMLMI